LAEHPFCEIQVRCKEFSILKQIAVEVDHVIPIEQRPDLRLVWENLQSTCKPCHDWKTFRREGARPVITLVCGPPLSGKSTYVEQRRQRHDLLLDYDEIMHAITGLPLHQRHQGPAGEAAHWLCLDAFQAMLKRCQQLEEPVRIWVVATLTDEDKREQLRLRLGADLVEMTGQYERISAIE
jgi:hypothetical protein